MGRREESWVCTWDMCLLSILGGVVEIDWLGLLIVSCRPRQIWTHALLPIADRMVNWAVNTTTMIWCFATLPRWIADKTEHVGEVLSKLPCSWDWPVCRVGASCAWAYSCARLDYWIVDSCVVQCIMSNNRWMCGWCRWHYTWVWQPSQTTLLAAQWCSCFGHMHVYTSSALVHNLLGSTANKVLTHTSRCWTNTIWLLDTSILVSATEYSMQEWSSVLLAWYCSCWVFLRHKIL